MQYLYHKEVYLPDEIKNLFANGIRFTDVVITEHAAEEAAKDRYGSIKVPRAISVRSSDIVEAEVTDKKLSKIVVRHKYDERRDLIAVIGIKDKKAFLKTLWTNLSNDVHRTLDKARYSTRHYLT